MATQQKHLGVTQPISEEAPKPIDIKLNDSLVEELKAQKSYELNEAMAKRREVLNLLQKCTQMLVKQVGQQKGLPANILDEAGGKIFTFGSYRLGVSGPSSDIDTLLACPRHVVRSDYFQHFEAIFRKLAAPRPITEFTPVPDAIVPIIKIKVSGVDIDLIFCALQQASVPPSQVITDDVILKGLSETDQKAVNGTRVADMMLQLVPQTKTFRHAIRTIKIWASKRAVYGNVFGFPGGIAWAIMVARICQLYPKATGALIVARFFTLYKSWSWPLPVLLNEVKPGTNGFRVWNPVTNPGDHRHIMPVITPAFPAMCSTHNITRSNFFVIKREIARGEAIVNDIFAGKKQWKDLFWKHTFFTQDYKHYISVITASRTKAAQSLWAGLVQSRIRRLVTGIEDSQRDSVEVAQPFYKSFEREHYVKNEQERDAVLSGSLKHVVSDVKETDGSSNVTQAAAAEGNAGNMEMPDADAKHEGNSDQYGTVFTTTFFVGIGLLKGAKSLDISYPTTDFKRRCLDWDQYKEDLNFIRVVHIKNYDLPPDVFADGETRPTKAAKARKPTEPANNKRSFSNTDMNENSDPNKRRQPGTPPMTNGVKYGQTD